MESHDLQWLVVVSIMESHDLKWPVVVSSMESHDLQWLVVVSSMESRDLQYVWLLLLCYVQRVLSMFDEHQCVYHSISGALNLGL